jgi:hypothetical protein
MQPQQGRLFFEDGAAQHGYQCAPYSAQRRKRNAAIGAGIGSLAMLLVPPQFRIAAAIAGVLTGAIAGYNKKPS